MTASLIEKDCPVLVQDLGKRIAVHYEKLVQCNCKGEQHKIAIGKLLLQAKEACDAGGFTAFRERFCPNLGRSRAHELLLIACGKKTIEETKTATRERAKKHRTAKKEASSKVLGAVRYSNGRPGRRCGEARCRIYRSAENQRQARRRAGGGTTDRQATGRANG